MSTFGKKVISVLLATLMILPIIPISAFASESDTPKANVSTINETINTNLYSVEYNSNSGLTGYTTSFGTSDLDVAYAFKAYSDAEMQTIANNGGLTQEMKDALEENPYKDWNADFVISFDNDVAKDSIGLSGFYSYASKWDINSWLGFLLPCDLLITDNDSQNNELRLLGSVGYRDNNGITYFELCKNIREFDCGVFNLSKANVGTTITVTLRLYETRRALNGTNDGTETGNTIDVGRYTYKFNSIGHITSNGVKYYYVGKGSEIDGYYNIASSGDCFVEAFGNNTLFTTENVTIVKDDSAVISNGKNDQGQEYNTLDNESDIKNAVDDTMNNSAASDFSNTGITEVVENRTKKVIQVLKNEAEKTSEEVSEQITNDSDVSGFIKINLTAATVETISDTKTDKTVTEMTFNVKPYVTTIVNNEEITAVLPNELITKPLTFRLPVSGNTTATDADVYHENEYIGRYEIQTDDNQEKYIELSASEFSKYKYSLLNSTDKHTVELTSRIKNSDATVAKVAGGGVWYSGDEVAVTAYGSSGYKFVGWYDSADTNYSNKLSSEQVYKFNMGDDDVSLVALYETSTGGFKLVVNGSKYTINDRTQTNRTDRTFAAGTVVFVEHVDSSKKFLYWVNSSNNVLSSQPKYQFTLVTDTQIRGVYSDAHEPDDSALVVFKNAYVQVLSSYKYTTSDTIEFPSKAPSKIGHTFTYWYIANSDGTPSSTIATEETIKAAMDENDIVIIVPGYVSNELSYTVNARFVDIDSGNYLQPTNTQTQAVGAICVNTAPSKIENKHFKYWKVNDKIVSYNNVYATLSGIEGTISLYAYYGDASETEQPIVNIIQSYARKDESGYVLSNVMQYEVPENCTINQVGFVLGTSATTFGGSNGSEKLVRGGDDVTDHEGTFTIGNTNGRYIMNVNAPGATNTLYVKAYIIYTDANAQSHTIYSDMSICSYNSVNTNTAQVATDFSRLTTSTVNLTTNVNITSTVNASASVPVGTLIKEDYVFYNDAKLTLNIIDADVNDKVKNNSFLFSEDVTGASAKAYDISISGIDSNNTKLIKVTLNSVLPTNQSTVELYHGNEKMTRVDSISELTKADTFFYDSTSGNVAICVTNFCNFTLIYVNNSVVVDNSKTYNQDPSDYIDDEHDATLNGDGTYSLKEKDSALINEEVRTVSTEVQTSHIDEESLSNINENVRDQITSENTNVSGVKLKPDTIEVGGKEVNEGAQLIIEKASEDNSFKKELDKESNEKNISIQVDVIIKPVEYVNSENDNSIKFELEPIATVTVTNGTEQDQSGVTKQIAISNDMIDQTEDIVVTLYSDFEPETIVHTDDNGNVIETFTGEAINYDKDTHVSTITIHHFSNIVAYEAVYHTVTWMNDNEVLTKSIVKDGIAAIYPIETLPTKDEDDNYTYSFSGWDSNFGEAVTSDITYKAKFSKNPKFSINVAFPNTDKYLYRVGNGNDIAVDSLFSVDSDLVSITDVVVTTIDFSSVSGSFDKDTRLIKFEGTGVVKVVAKIDDVCSNELYLEVVDAINATTAISATGNSVVLLNDVQDADRISITGGNTLYGNGFKLQYSSDNGVQGQNKISNYNYGYVTLSDGTLENVQIICQHFGNSYGIVSGDNTTQPDGIYYYYMVSAVYAIGNSSISNSYIYGARSNVYVTSGNVKVSNTVCELGATANIHVLAGHETSVTLNNVTTMQYIKDGVYGFGILVGNEKSTSNAKIIINGYLNQYNWINSSNGINNSYIVSGLDSALKINDYKNNGYINSGIVCMNEYTLDIEDNRSNKEDYLLSTISIGNSLVSYSGQVYSVKTGKGVVETKDAYSHSPVSNGFTKPTMTFNDDNGSFIKQGNLIKLEISNNDNNEYNINNLFEFNVRGMELTPSIASLVTEDGISYNIDNDGNVMFTRSGSYTITYKVTDNNVYDKDGKKTNESIDYYLDVKLQVSVVNSNINDAEFAFDKSKQKFYYTKVGGENKQYIPILDGLSIYDYNESNEKYKVYDFDNENLKATDVILRVEHTNVTRNDGWIKRSISTFYLNNGGVLTIEYDTSADSHGSTYTTSLKTDSSGKIFAVNDGVTSADDSVSWPVAYYEYTGNNGKTVRYDVPSSTTSMIMTTDAYKNGDIDLGKAVDKSGGRTNYYQNDGFGRDSVTILDSQGLPANGVLFTGAGDLILYKIATSTDASGFYCYRYGNKYTRKDVTFQELSFDTNKITLNTNSNDSFSDKMYILAKDSVSSSGTIFREGFVFGGWFTKAIGGEKVGEQDINGNYWKLSNYNISGDLILYAHWLKDVTISFDTQGGSETNKINTESSLGIPLPDAPTKEGYSFKGWYDEAGNADGTGATFQGMNGETYYVPEEDVTLYAHWEESTVEYTVTFDYNDGNTQNSSEKYTAGGNVIVLPSPKYGGNGGEKAATFAGWYDGDTKITTETYSPSEDVTLTAHWTPKTYTITLAGGNSKISGTFKYNEQTKSWSNPGGGTKFENIPYGTKVEFTVTNTKKGSGDSSDYKLSEVKTSGLTNNVNYTNSDNSVQTYSGSFVLDDDCTFTAKRSSASGGCFATGTMITLSDGTKKAIEEISCMDKVLTWDFNTGKAVSTSVISITNHGLGYYSKINMVFSNGNSIDVIEMHDFFSLEEYRFITIDSSNVQSYINHSFAFVDDNGIVSSCTLVSYDVSCVEENAYSIFTANNVNAIAENMLTLSPSAKFLVPFEINEDMKYDENYKNNAIEQFGLLSYDEFIATFKNDSISREVFDALGAKYIKIAIGLGVATMDEIAEYASILARDTIY